MSSKAIKNGIHKSSPESAGMVIVGQIIEYLLAIVLVILCFAVTLYAKDGYHQIGNAKFAAYRTVMVIGGILLLVALVPYIVLWVKRYMREHGKIQLSVTDGFVLAYLGLTVLSVISGGFYEDALWGCFGWNMGFMSQLSFVLLYFWVSRFGRYHRLILTALCTAAVIVYVIGILHRLLIDPIGFYDGLEGYQKAQFLSTLGQATWYGSFLAVTLPLGIGTLLWSEQKLWSVLGGIFTTLGFCTLVTQNSDSAYFAMAGVFLILFMASMETPAKIWRFMGVLTLFFGAGKWMCLLMRLHPNPDLQVDFITDLMWNSWITWVLFGICLLAAVAMYAAKTKRTGRERRAGKSDAGDGTGFSGRHTIAYRIVPIAAVAAVAAIVLVICLQARGVFPESISERLSQVSYFNWNDDWGNGRGRIWRFSAKVFAEEDIVNKLLGVGPDCFNSYVSDHYGEEAKLLWGEKMLTNAHNEWLNILINGGILGAGAYLGIYVTAIRRFLSAGRKGNAAVLIGIAAAGISYLCYNFFCYQQVLCTPFIFILMGAGEYIVRESRE